MMKRKYFMFIPILVTVMIEVSGCGFSPHTYYPAVSPEESIRSVSTIDVNEYTVTGKRNLYFKEIPHAIVVDGLEETEMTLAFCPNVTDIKAVYGYYDLQDFVKPQFKGKLADVKALKSGQINKELVLTMKPDLLIAEQCSFMPKSLGNTDFWNTRGIKTYVPVNTNSPGKHIISEKIETEFAYIKDFGKLFGQEEKANQYVDDAQKTLEFFQNNHDKTQPVQNVMIIENFGGSIASYDRTKLGGDIVTRLGGKISETKPLIGKEELLGRDPDVLFIVCSDGDHGECLKRFCQNPEFKKMTAIKNHRVYSIELETMYAPGIRVKDGIEKIGLGLYPELSEKYWVTQNSTINPSYINWLKYKSMDDFEANGGGE